jgi:hypothetical protein
MIGIRFHTRLLKDGTSQIRERTDNTSGPPRVTSDLFA